MNKRIADFNVVAAFLAVVSMSVSADMAVEKIDGSFPVEAFNTQNGLVTPVSAYSPDEIAQFNIREGETMKDAMERWTKTVGYSLVWQPEPEDGDIEFARGMTFENSFRKASSEFFEIIRGQSKFDAQLHSNGVLRVFVADEDK
jgi:hypothetical protein